jgi:hypothetical protein
VSDEQQGYPGAPPGWYPDPAGGPGQRWWDGYAWSDAVTQPTVPPPPPEPWAVASTRLASSQSGELVQVELSMTPVARVALAYTGISALVLLLFIRVNASQLRNVGHQFHGVIQAAQNNLPAPSIAVPPLNGAVGALESVNWLVTLSAFVIALIWQHRAASAARALGLPGRHSPAWGVGSWFVPVVGLWFPYQALVDCLGPNDPNRGVVLRFWLCRVGLAVGLPAAILAAFLNATASLVISIPVAVLALGLLATAPQVVTAIATAHANLQGGQATAVPR